MIKQFKPATRRLLVFTLPPLAALLAMLTFTAATQKKLPPTKSPPTERAATNPLATLNALQRQFAIETDRV